MRLGFSIGACLSFAGMPCPECVVCTPPNDHLLLPRQPSFHSNATPFQRHPHPQVREPVALALRGLAAHEVSLEAMVFQSSDSIKTACDVVETYYAAYLRPVEELSAMQACFSKQATAGASKNPATPGAIRELVAGVCFVGGRCQCCMGAP